MRIAIVVGSHPLERMGGAEYQALLLAEGLAGRGHSVTYLAADANSDASFTERGVRFCKVSGSEVVGRSANEKLVTEELVSGKYDICYIRYFNRIALATEVCRSVQVPLVTMTCSGIEATPFIYRPSLGYFVHNLQEAIAHSQSFMAIHSSAAHVCISRCLKASVQRWHPSKAIQVVYNGVPVPMDSDLQPKSGKRIIWVNNIKRLKRPELFIKLAQQLPEYEFVMIGRMAEGSYGKYIEALLQSAPNNLIYFGPLSFDATNAQIGQSDLLLYTSEPVEGFGNSFIQAWLRNVPTVSLQFDPDGIIEGEGLGRCSMSFEQMVEDVTEYMRSDAIRVAAGHRAREYAMRCHSAERMITDYEHLFKSIVGGK